MREGDGAGQLGAQDAVVGVDVAGNSVLITVSPKTLSASLPISADACLASIRIGFACTKPASARASTSSSATGMSIGSRSRNSSSGVINGARSTLSWWEICSSRS